ncbi:MAG: hypothetical protein EXR65_02600 [Dehalococcoidia bacterium]|nr:hypothetical protein [Dehalococcoidia bacterium]
MRREFRTNENFGEIASWIEHYSADGNTLRALIEQLIPPEADPYTLKFDDTERELNQRLDNYLNYLDSVASMYWRG